MILNKCPHLSAIEEILHDIAKISKFAIPAGDWYYCAYFSFLIVFSTAIY